MRKFMPVTHALRLTVAAFALLNVDALAHETEKHDAAPPARASVITAESGTIRELVVVDRIAATSTRLVSLIPARGRALALRGPAIDALQPGAYATVTGVRNGDTLFVESVDAMRTADPPRFAAKIASVTDEGTLAVLHADDFERGTSHYVYELHRDDGATTELDLGIRPEVLRPGMRIAASGVPNAAAQSLEVDRIDIFAMPAGTEPAPDGTSAVTNHPVLVILFKFTNSGSDPFPVSTAQQVMVSDRRQLVGGQS